VLFYGDDRLQQYDVETAMLSTLQNMGPYGLHLVDGGRRILALRAHAVEVRDPAGKLLKTIEVPWRTESRHVVSEDGRLIAFLQVPFVIVDLERPRTALFATEELISSPTFAPGGGTLYYFSEHLNALNIASGEVKKLARIPSPRTATAATTLLPVRRG
jgi:sugar lactone lactonase YvrE